MFHGLVDLCRGHKVFIQTHNFPDPDAIASAFGLQRLLARFEIPAALCYDGRIDKLSASKLLSAFHIEMTAGALAMQPEDYVICVDSQKNGGNITDFNGNEVACIDHHPTFVPVDYLYQDVRLVGACATLIARYYRDLGLEPDCDTATALLYGLKMDTLQFTRGVTPLDIEMFAFLFRFCDPQVLARLERNNMEFSDLRAYAAAIESIHICGGVGFSGVRFPCPDAMIATLSDFILSLLEVEVAVVFSHRGDSLKFSVRSEDPRVHAGELVRRALKGLGDGGGHAVMAGGLIPQAGLEKLGACPEDRIREIFLRECSHILEGQ